jgi:hypothetical protein
MLIQELHDVRLSWIELEPLDLRIDFPRRVALLDFCATDLGGGVSVHSLIQRRCSGPRQRVR